jgi:hypothetical protein
MDKKQKAQDKLERFDRITAAIAALEQQKKLIFATGQVAPKGCVVARYQVRQQQKIYWYYKLQAQTAIFAKANDDKALSKYKHLGSCGSEAHITAVIQMARRSQIDEIQRTIDTLEQNLLDVGFDDQQKEK